MSIDGKGYLLVQSNGSVRAFGSAKTFKIKRGAAKPKSIVAIATTGTGRGYLLVSSTGKVTPYGDARHFGDRSGKKADSKIVGIVMSPNGGGYNLVSAKGTVYSYGNARRYLNLAATMLLGGLWHGAAWTFVIWGALHGIYLVINHAWQALRERLFGPGKGPSCRLVGHSAFRGEGRLRGRWHAAGGWCDSALYGLLADELVRDPAMRHDAAETLQ